MNRQKRLYRKIRRLKSEIRFLTFIQKELLPEIPKFVETIMKIRKSKFE